MSEQEAYGKLIKVAAKLLSGSSLESSLPEDHKQKTYSRKRVAAMMARSMEIHRLWAIDIRDAVNALRDAAKAAGAGVERWGLPK